MPRSLTLDLLRSLALVLMVIYHIVYDLSAFGWNVDAFSMPMILLARTSLILFLFTAGASFAVKRESGSGKIPWQWMQTRLLLLFATSVAVSIGTYVVDPNTFVQFGVLHMITVGTLLLWLLPASIPLSLALALALTGLSFLLPTQTQTSLLLPLGIPPTGFASVDYVPLLPWFGVMLLGCALWPLVPSMLKLNRMYDRQTTIWTWAGRHTLWVYLVHQPVLWGLMYLALNHKS